MVTMISPMCSQSCHTKATQHSNTVESCLTVFEWKPYTVCDICFSKVRVREGDQERITDSHVPNPDSCVYSAFIIIKYHLFFISCHHR